MKPVCVKCQRFYRMRKAGYYFVEGMPRPQTERHVQDEIVGLRNPRAWQPYKLWVGDLWECPDCHTQIVSGVASHPIAEHYQPEFGERVDRLGAGQLLVKDC